MPKITRHAQKRMKERCGIGKGSVDKMAKRAYQNGLAHSETKGKLNKYISSLYFKNHNANNVRIYAEKVWIFNNDKLITVYHIPQDLVQDANKQIKQRNEKEKEKKND